MNKPYNEWLQESNKLNKLVDILSKDLRAKYKPNPLNGLVPETIRLSPEYRVDKSNFDQAFKYLRAFNSASPKGYSKRKRKETRGY